MLFSATKEHLVRALTKIQGVITTTSPQQNLGYLCLQAKSQQLFLKGTNLETGIQVVIPADTATEGEVLVPAKKFHEIVKEMPADQITVSLDVHNYRVGIVSGKASFLIVALNPKDYPTIVFSPEAPVVWRARDLCRLIAPVTHAISSDETKPTLNGTLLQYAAGKCTTIATDGHRLAMMTISTPDLSLVGKGILIPRKAAQEIVKLFHASSDEISIGLNRERSALAITTIDTGIYVELLPGPFPPCQKLIPSTPGTSIMVARPALLETVKRVRLFNSGDKDAFYVRIIPGSFSIYSDEKEKGNASEDVDFSGTIAADMDIRVNSRYVLDALAAIEEEHVELTFRGPRHAITISSGESFLGLLMPMR